MDWGMDAIVGTPAFRAPIPVWISAPTAAVSVSPHGGAPLVERVARTARLHEHGSYPSLRRCCRPRQSPVTKVRKFGSVGPAKKVSLDGSKMGNSLYTNPTE
jgi:hypothetical protein